MEIFMDILEEILEEVFALLVTSPKVPKPIRYAVVLAVAGFIIAIGIILGIQSDMLAGRIFGFALAALGSVAGVYLARKVYRS